MARRRASFVDLLLVLPWWVSAVLAVVAYLVLTYAAPAWFSANKLTVGISQGLSHLTPLVCGLFIALALLSFIRSWFVARKFDRQKDLDDIRSLSWRQFESIVGEAFRRRGYTVVENAVDGADGGVDLLLRKDGEKFFVQCKQWKKISVGVKPVRELFGVMSAGKATGGFFVASGSYTPDAREFARSCGVELIDGDGLLRMIEEARSPEPFMDPTQGRRAPITTNAAPVPAASPLCPVCGEGMLERVAKRGANAGTRFWGCSGIRGVGGRGRCD